VTKETKIRFQWQLNWKIIIFVLFFLPVTVSLAFWQLDRADQKNNLLSIHKDRANADPILFSEINDIYTMEGDALNYPDYVRVELNGKYDNQSTLLLDNRVRNSRPGYDVISLFQTNNRQWILVNRGWVAAGLDRRILPELPLISGKIKINGYLYRSPGKQIMLGDDPWTKGKDRIVIQSLDPELISEKLGINFYKFSLRLNESEPGALTTGWPVVNVQPGKHTGYAFQWTALTIALIILAIFANSNLGQLISSSRR
jgi:cytochrome oxidase assembly protein ShyY1